MRTITGTGISMIVPDDPCSMFDEELFIEIVKATATDGEIINVTINGNDVPVVMWNGTGRYYLDALSFDDLSVAALEFSITAPLSETFNVIPKKSIRNPKWWHNILPLFFGANVFSTTLEIEIVEYIDGEPSGHVIDPFTKAYFVPDPAAEYYTIGDWPNQLPFRAICPDSYFFQWIDDDGMWRSWYFRKGEVRKNASGGQINRVENQYTNGNVRFFDVEMKGYSETTTYFDTGGLLDWLDILNSIKTSSYVLMWNAEDETDERVNIVSEETTSKNNLDEISFKVIRKTKVAI